MSTTRKKDIVFGKEDLLPEDEFSHKNVKQRITVLVDEFVVDALKKEAAEKGTKYQTMIREILRDHVQGPSLEERLARVEAAIFKKHA
jgi:predicted DNA binding CopG/RHH family protein